MHDSHWKQVVTNELKSLTNTNSWTLTTLPPHKMETVCKRIFKTNLHASDNIERYKIRLVAKGFNQTKNIDYLKTFTLVIKMTTIRLLISLASSKNWLLHQSNINTNLLRIELFEMAYMKCPLGLNVPKKGLVCRLNKFIYGLQQTSRQCHEN